MKERPILFKGDMVRAIHAGQKTQTRRIVKPRKDFSFGVELAPHELAGEINNGDYTNCPYGKPGDKLWVREAWRVHRDADHLPPRDLPHALTVIYEADGYHDRECGKYRPPMFMPRWACRLVLEVVSVRVERLQDISAPDALAEGISCHPDHHDKPSSSIYSPVGGFRELWESINGDESWQVNPWVWVIEIKVAP